MEFTDYMLVKLVVLGVLAFIVNFVYRLVTGRSLSEDRQRGTQAAEVLDQTKAGPER